MEMETLIKTFKQSKHYYDGYTLHNILLSYGYDSVIVLGSDIGTAVSTSLYHIASPSSNCLRVTFRA